MKAIYILIYIFVKLLSNTIGLLMDQVSHNVCDFLCVLYKLYKIYIYFLFKFLLDPRPEYQHLYIEESRFLPKVHNNPHISNYSSRSLSKHGKSFNHYKL